MSEDQTLYSDLFEWQLQVPGWETWKPESEELRAPSRAFQSNCLRIKDLVFIPKWVSVSCLEASYQVAYESHECGRLGVMELTDEQRAEIQQRWRGELCDSNEAAKAFVETAFMPIHMLMKQDNFRRAAKALVLTAMTQLWTAFECYMRDLWIAAMNSVGEQVIRAKLKQERNQESLVDRQLSIRSLADFDFNIKGRIGDFLSREHDFNSVDGMKSAYVKAFRNAGSFDSIFNDRALLRFEKTRHLIVHKGGRVDAKYRSETGCNQPVGDELSIHHDLVQEFCDVSLKAATEVKNVMDRCVIGMKKQGQALTNISIS